MNICTSVSSLVSSSAAPFPFPDGPDTDVRDQEVDAEGPPARCKPAFSRSPSFHDSIVANRLSISKRLLSARGVVKNESKTFVTSLRSTLLSV